MKKSSGLESLTQTIDSTPSPRREFSERHFTRRCWRSIAILTTVEANPQGMPPEAAQAFTTTIDPYLSTIEPLKNEDRPTTTQRYNTTNKLCRRMAQVLGGFSTQEERLRQGGRKALKLKSLRPRLC